VHGIPVYSIGYFDVLMRRELRYKSF
jgi:hypothetical protein